MGLFGNKKEEKKDIPAPPAPSAVNNASAPESSGSNSVLSAPPMPKTNGSFDDIKSQVTSSATPEESTHKPSALEQSVSSSNDISTNVQGGISEEKSETSFDSGDDDSLFDFSSLDVDGVDDNSSHEEVSSILESHQDHGESPNFIRNTHLRKHVSEDFFVTTSQFKGFLEIIDSVKDRVKDSSERHLRLLDIKSEEDIEYENLRKDFQFIEDKLYEIDSLIFEK